MRLWQYAKQLLRKTISSFRECDVSKILATISHHHPPLWVGYKTTVFMLYLLLALPCYGSFDYNTSLKLSQMRQQSDNNDKKSCREGPPVQGTPPSLPSQYSSLANMCYCQSRDHSILLNMLSTVHCSCSSTSRSEGLSNLHKPGRNQQASPHSSSSNQSQPRAESITSTLKGSTSSWFDIILEIEPNIGKEKKRWIHR